MKKILILALLVATYPIQAAEIEVFVQSYNSASVTTGQGTVEYSQTNARKGQLTAGNSLELKLYGLPEGILQEVTIAVKSNTSSGAGEMSLTMAGNELWTIPNSSFKQWNDGSYSTAYVPISKVISAPLQDTIVLRIKATENSIYWQSLTITYEPATPVAHTVQFVTGTDVTIEPMTETEGNAGIVLPSIEDPDDDWRFLGWVLEPVIEETSDYQASYLAETRFFPLMDRTIYALYGWRTTQEVDCDTILADGEYIIAQEWLGNTYMAEGAVSYYRLPIVQTSQLFLHTDSSFYWRGTYIPDNQRYVVTKSGDSITIQHKESHDFVGYDNQHHLRATKSLWHYQPAAHRSVMVDTSWGERHYAIYYSSSDYVDEPDEMAFTLQWLTYDKQSPGILFFPVTDIPDTAPAARYTSYPYGFTDLMETTEPPLPMKFIREGQIIIRRGGEYNLFGQRVD